MYDQIQQRLEDKVVCSFCKQFNPKAPPYHCKTCKIDICKSCLDDDKNHFSKQVNWPLNDFGNWNGLGEINHGKEKLAVNLKLQFAHDGTITGNGDFTYKTIKHEFKLDGFYYLNHVAIRFTNLKVLSGDWSALVIGGSFDAKKGLHEIDGAWWD